MALLCQAKLPVLPEVSKVSRFNHPPGGSWNFAVMGVTNHGVEWRRVRDIPDRVQVPTCSKQASDK